MFYAKVVIVCETPIIINKHLLECRQKSCPYMEKSRQKI